MLYKIKNFESLLSIFKIYEINYRNLIKLKIDSLQFIFSIFSKYAN